MKTIIFFIITLFSLNLFYNIKIIILYYIMENIILKQSTFTHFFFDQYLQNDGISSYTDLKIYNDIESLGFKNKMISRKNPNKNIVFIEIGQAFTLNFPVNDYFIANGWSGTILHPGHRISTYIEFNQDTNFYNIIFSNSGLGVNYHLSDETDNINYNVIKYEESTLDDVTQLIFFLKFINKLSVDYTINKEKLLNKGSVKTFYNDYKKDKIFYYYEILKEFFSSGSKNYEKFYYETIYKILGVKENQIGLDKGYKQMMGSCTFWAPFSLFKYLMGTNYTEFSIAYKSKQICNFKQEFNNQFDKSPKEYYWSAYLLAKDNLFEGKKELEQKLIEQINVLNTVDNINYCPVDNTIKLSLEFMIEITKYYNEFIENVNKNPLIFETLICSTIKKILNLKDHIKKLLESMDWFYIILSKIIREGFQIYHKNIDLNCNPIMIENKKFFDNFKLKFKYIINNIYEYFKNDANDQDNINLIIYITMQFLIRIDTIDVNYNSLIKIYDDKIRNQTYDEEINSWILGMHQACIIEDYNSDKYVKYLIKFKNILYTKNSDFFQFCDIPYEDNHISKHFNLLIVDITNPKNDDDDIFERISRVDESMQNAFGFVNNEVSDNWLYKFDIDNIVNNINNKKKIIKIYPRLLEYNIYNYTNKSYDTNVSQYDISKSKIITISTLMHKDYNYQQYINDVLSKLKIDNLIESLNFIDNFSSNILEIILVLVIKLNQMNFLTMEYKNQLIGKLNELDLKQTLVYQYLNGDYSKINFRLLNNEYLESQTNLIFTTVTNKAINLTYLPNYNFINNNDFYKKTLFCYYCYTKDSKIFYYINNNLIEITYNSHLEKIYKKIKSINYEYLNNRLLYFELINSNKNNFFILLQKLNLCLKDLSYSVWFNQDTITKNYIIEIFHNNNIINFEIKNKIGTTNYDIKLNYDNMVFDVIESDGILSVFWTLFMNNGILVKKNNDLFIFMIIDKKFINDSLFKHNMQWTEQSNKLARRDFILRKNYFHFIKFNSLKVNFQFINSNDFCALFLSLIISQNIVAISLLRSRILTELNNNNSVYEKQMTYISIYTKHINIPYWFLLLNDQLNTPERLEYAKFKSIDQKITKFNLSNFNKINFINLIHSASNKIQKYKFRYNESSLSCKLNKFLQRFREKCGKIINYDKSSEKEKEINLNKIYCEINRKQLYTLNENNYEINILKDLIIIDYNTKDLEIIPNIYLKYYQQFYTNLIYKLYLDIYEKIKKIDQTKLSCALILQTIELLDINLIYNFNKERTITDVLFELQSELFIRDEQKTKINSLLECIENDNNYAYEILMGKGKTTTMTPYLLIKNLLLENNKLGIILPSHLVESSYNIMVKYCEIFTNITINKVINYSFYNYNNKTINIVSDNIFKEVILKLKLVNDVKNIEKINNTFYVYDEIDTLINPLKSDLNISNNNSEFIHPNFNHIINILFYVSKFDFNFLLIMSEKNKLLICNTKDQKINTFELPDLKFTETFCNKLNNMKNTVRSLHYNKNYGFSKINNGEKNKLNYIAIPYIANDYPSEGSEFSDFELSIYLTIKAYQNRFLNNNNLFELFNFLNKYYFEIIKLTQNELIQAMIKHIDEDTLKEIIKSSESKNKFNFYIKKLDKIRCLLQDIFIIDYYSKYFVFEKFFKIFKTQYNISFVDLFDKNLIKRKISFSGTVNFNLPSDILTNLNSIKNLPYYKQAIESQLNKIEIDEFYQGEIESAINSSTQDIKSQYICYTNMENNEENLINYLRTNIIIAEKLKYNALIDVGGIIVKNKPLDIIKIIYNITKDYNVILLYVNDNGQKMIYGENQSKIYSDEIFQNVFIYYDNKNCVGMDFKQPLNMHGLVILNNYNTLTEVSQGIYRLRKINISHTIDYYLPDTFKSSDIELYSKLNEIEIQNKTNTVSRSNIQCLKYLLRNKNNYLKENYNEEKYYDTIAYNSTFITEKNFIDNFFYTKGIFYNDFNINQTINLQIHLIQQQQQQQQEQQQQQQQQTKINVLSNLHKKYGKIKFKFINKTKRYISYNELINISIKNNFKINNLDGNDIFKIGMVSIVLSPFLHGLLYQLIEKYDKNYKKEMNLFFDNCYFVINDIARKKILVVHVSEFFLIKKYIEINKSFKDNIIIFDQFGNIVFNNQEVISKKNKEIIILLNAFMFKSKLSLTDRIVYIQYYNFYANQLSDNQDENEKIKFQVNFFIDIIIAINNKIDFKESIELDKLKTLDKCKKLEYCIEKFKISSDHIDKIPISFIKKIEEFLFPKQSQSGAGLVGGSNNEFYEKYIKYKNKYFYLKNINFI